MLYECIYCTRRKINAKRVAYGNQKKMFIFFREECEQIPSEVCHPEGRELLR
jgi:hypothetical protein